MKARVTVNMPNGIEHSVLYESDDLNTIWKDINTDFPDLTSVIIIVVKSDE